MPNQDYTKLMARYNHWQNESLIIASNSLPVSALEKDMGAFFGSILKTCSHLLWGDSLWMSRFTDHAAPVVSIEKSGSMVEDWSDICDQRRALDALILKWSESVEAGWFEGPMSFYSAAIGREVTKPKARLVVHFFNHQTHHRGQIHAMLTAAGATTTASDIPFMPDSFDQL